MPKTSSYRKRKEVLPDGGHYEPYNKFGSDAKGVDFGSKYKFKPDSNPPPGYYDIDAATSIVKSKSSAAMMV